MAYTTGRMSGQDPPMRKRSTHLRVLISRRVHGIPGESDQSRLELKRLGCNLKRSLRVTFPIRG